MIRVEVIEDFTLQRYDELKNIQRRNLDTKGKLYKGDTFECSEELTKYLSGDNKLKRAFVRVIEVEPEIIKTNDEIRVKKDNVEVIINKNEIVKEIKKQSKKKKVSKK